MTPNDAGHVVNMVLKENRGNILTEALCIGIEQAVIFYCSRIDMDKGPKLVEKGAENA